MFVVSGRQMYVVWTGLEGLFFTFTGLGIVKQLVTGWALTVVASSMIKTGMTAAAIIDITFIDIWK